MSQLVLPACVETRDDGKVVVRGHRVSLHLILDAYYSGLSVEEILERYPSIPREAVREIVEFCSEHDEQMRQFHAECEAERQRIAGTIETPDLQGLRRRKS